MNGQVATTGSAPEVLSALRSVFIRDLTAVGREIAAYPDDASLWKTVPGVANSAGTLALHAAGNIQHFIGATLGHSGYQRDREAEFSRRDLPRTALAAEIEKAVQAVDRALPGLTPEQLYAPYPLLIAGRRVRTLDFLVHLATHLSYHLGQVDYHRRILTGGEAVETVLPQALPTVEGQ